MTNAYSETVQVTRAYYNHTDADNYYFHVWGGEDIHIGLYDRLDEDIATASRRTVERLADRIDGRLSSTASHVIDLGAGYGGAAHYLAQHFRCRVLALNLSETQNQRHREMNAAAGLSELIEVVDGTFEAIPAENASFDIVWSQDALLHSGRRAQVLGEVDRVLKPGGEFIFTDTMQSDDCPHSVLAPVLDYFHLTSLGSFTFYEDRAQRLGWEQIEVSDRTDQLVAHYVRLAEVLSARRESLCGKISDVYVEAVLTHLESWVEAGRKGYLAWGVLHFRKPG